MPKRHKPTRRQMKCAEPGCSEFAYWTFDNRVDYVAHCKRVNVGQWRCTRHTNPEEVLSIDNRSRVWVSPPALPSDRYPEIDRAKLFFGSSGFLYGPGFKAYAVDFPPGTKIKVTAEVLLP